MIFDRFVSLKPEILTPNIKIERVSRNDFNIFVRENEARYVDFRGKPGNVTDWLTSRSPSHYTDEAYNCSIGLVKDSTEGVKLFHLLPSEALDRDGTLRNSPLHGFNTGTGITNGIAIVNPRTEFYERHKLMLSKYPLNWITFPEEFVYACLGYNPSTDQTVYAFHNDYLHHLEQ
jgi:hypothetical protein